MMAYFAGRAGSALLVVFGVLLLVFYITRVIPGDPVEIMMGEQATASDQEKLRHQLNLDQPVAVQFYQYMKKLASLDLGTSYSYKVANLDLLLNRLPATMHLALASLVVAVCIAFPLGMYAALHQGTWVDRGATMFSLLGVSIPNFWLGPLLILFFAVMLGWFPVSGRESWMSIVLPALTLGSSMAAILTRMVRSTLLEILGEDYIRTARAKGLSQGTIVLRHALPNAMLPLLTLLGLQFGALLGGAVITETIFAWPGIGGLTVEAILKRDYSLVQACVLLISVIYVVINTSMDMIYGWADPRIRWR